MITVFIRMEIQAYFGEPFMTKFVFDISATDGAARTGVLKTARGDIQTPAFMPWVQRQP